MLTGFNKHRLKKDDPYYTKEVIFAETFHKEFSGFKGKEIEEGLRDITGIKNSNESSKYLTEREQRIALSVIQWLGTPVGQGFLEKVQKEIDSKEK